MRADDRAGHQHLVDLDHPPGLGPGAGHDGGRIVFEGTPADLVAARSTLTGQHLATRCTSLSPNARATTWRRTGLDAAFAIGLGRGSTSPFSTRSPPLPKPPTAPDPQHYHPDPDPQLARRRPHELEQPLPERAHQQQWQHIRRQRPQQVRGEPDPRHPEKRVQRRLHQEHQPQPEHRGERPARQRLPCSRTARSVASSSCGVHGLARNPTVPASDAACSGSL